MTSYFLVFSITSFLPFLIIHLVIYVLFFSFFFFHFLYSKGSCSPSSSHLNDISIGLTNQGSLNAIMTSTVHSPNANPNSSPSSSPCSLSSSSPSSLCSSSSPSTSESSPNAINGSYVSSNVLPSFDLLRSSCSLDLECHGGHHSPSSNGQLNSVFCEKNFAFFSVKIEKKILFFFLVKLACV